MELPRGDLTDQKHLKAETAFCSAAPCPPCDAPLLRWSIVELAGVLPSKTLCSEDLLIPVLDLCALADCQLAQ